MIKRFSLIFLSLLMLSACSEKIQSLGNKKDAAAYSGTTDSFVAPGWNAGDKNSWEQHLRARGQYGMNDHSRAP